MWRVRLNAVDPHGLWPSLSADEQARARRFGRDRDSHDFIVAHGMLRRILARYQLVPPESLSFVSGSFGKPTVTVPVGASALEFNMSHSGDVSLVAVARGGPVGIDVERWDREIDHVDLAEQFFSPAERSALRALGPSAERLTEGFFNAWTRKEAYLKATGEGIAHGLHHFDVSLDPESPAALLADRHDPTATDRWRMAAIPLAADYSAAIVVASGVSEILHFDCDESPPLPEP